MNTRKEDSFESVSMEAMIKAAEAQVNYMLEQRGYLNYEDLCNILGIDDKRERICVSIEFFKNTLILNWWKCDNYTGVGNRLVDPSEEEIKELLMTYKTDWTSGRDLCEALKWTRNKNTKPEEKKRSFFIDYQYQDGESSTSIDILDGPFDQMVNDLFSLVYQITDESGERDVRITNVEEVPYNG